MRTHQFDLRTSQVPHAARAPFGSQPRTAKLERMLALGGIEAGGTKFVCAVGHPPDDLELMEIPTTTPEETISRVLDFFKARLPLRAIGIASFGPVDLDPLSATFGFITWTPKLRWRNFDFAGSVRSALRAPVAFDT